MCKNTKIWMKAAIMRAIRTIAQTFVATVGTAAVMSKIFIFVNEYLEKKW